MATSGLSCKSELGPNPVVTLGVVTNGLAGPTIIPKKNAETT
jgi:hypothetical protein